MRLGAGVQMEGERFSMVFTIGLLILNIASLILFNPDVNLSLQLFNISRDYFFLVGLPRLLWKGTNIFVILIAFAQRVSFFH